MIYDVCVVGGGVVGTAIWRALSRRGLKSVLVEKGTIGCGVSAGNTGIACTLLDIPEDTLEARCLQRALSLNSRLHAALNIPRHCCGTLYTAWTAEELQLLSPLARRAHEASAKLRATWDWPEDGVPPVLQQSEVAALEPSLPSGVLGGVLVAGETVVDPGLVPLAYAADALAAGGELYEHTEVVHSAQALSSKGRCWRIGMADACSVSMVEARMVVNCGGLGADVLQSALQPQECTTLGSLQFRPRRGDYLVFRSPDATSETNPAPILLQHPIGSVPTALARGVYVWTTVHGDVAVGPSNVEQRTKDLPPISSKALKELYSRALQVCPLLAEWRPIAAYSGLRPALHREAWGTDYVIKPDPSGTCITVAGVRSTGLTGSSGIAAHVADMLLGQLGTELSDEVSHEDQVSALPSIAELRAMFKASCDGSVELQGRKFVVSHPITRLGLAWPSLPSPRAPGSDRGSAMWLKHELGLD